MGPALTPRLLTLGLTVFLNVILYTHNTHKGDILRKNIFIQEQQIKLLDNIKKAKGMSHSETIRHAIEEYHEKLKRKGMK